MFLSVKYSYLIHTLTSMETSRQFVNLAHCALGGSTVASVEPVSDSIVSQTRSQIYIGFVRPAVHFSDRWHTADS